MVNLKQNDSEKEEMPYVGLCPLALRRPDEYGGARPMGEPISWIVTLMLTVS